MASLAHEPVINLGAGRGWRWHLMRKLLAGFFLFVACLIAGWTAWGISAWLRFAHPVLQSPPDAMETRFMPSYEVLEQHQRVVHASPARAFEAAQAFRMDDSRIVHAIFRSREIIFRQPSSSMNSQPFMQFARQIGWGVLDSIPGREIVFGAITQPWQGDVHFRALKPEEFAAFDSAGYAKIVWNMAVDSLGPNTARVRTETRVVTTDRESRAKFRRYWSIYSPGIVLIRRELLRLIANSAERAK